MFDFQLHSDENLENLKEFALNGISRDYPLIFVEETILPPGLTMYLRVEWWWIEVILQNSKYIV